MSSAENTIWGRAQKMLLVVNFTSMDEMKKYREALKDIGLNVHECDILAVVGSKKEKNALGEISNVTYCSDQEVNILGKLKNEEAVKVMSRKFDVVVFFGSYSKKMVRQFRKMKSLVTVGVNSDVEFLTINLSMESSKPVDMLNFVKETLKKIQ